MNKSLKFRTLQKESAFKKKVVADISKCFKASLRNENFDQLESKLKVAIKSTIKKFEDGNKISQTVNFDTEFAIDSNQMSIGQLHPTNPEIERLKQKKSALEFQLKTKEEELRNLNRRTNLAKDLTRNEAIKGLVLNVIQKFKTLSEEQQLELINNKEKLERAVKNYVKNFIVYYDEEEKAWAINFKKSDVTNAVTTGKDVVVLAANLSSKYVNIATNAIHKATLAQYEICKKERNELKSKLEDVNEELEREYDKMGKRPRFTGGFGGGRFGGGGSFDEWRP
ncbi:hypothetical protein Q4603_19545 [Zobellia galactanivorans]|uniref:Uncharacterized protein n=1 Tax=Zobellia galactanivorans (strain DSM 12802 / CCUG 47099 / CIP 106680 / NCIMB 13871 / Dsij) TaxID=63186 RepID=G0L2K4_ZOBGA|nr:hypothetical protein [Zobellia galactanivorans]MDO6810824.1 hypothetical protein [Zobellia galactanivorans]CAZ95041.1 Hypothetical protein ZOBELLIA_983 [Zobellia galactanivorans]